MTGTAGESNVTRIGSGQTQAFIAGTVNASGLASSGTITAAGFSGDGSGLTNISVSQTNAVSKTGDTMTGDLVVPSLTATGNIVLPSPTTTTSGFIKQGANTLIHTFGTNNFFAGLGAGSLTFGEGSGNNTGVGSNALMSNTFGYDNTAVGFDALMSNTTGYYNAALGNYALRGNTSGKRNIAIGYYAIASNISGNGNTASGYEALSSSVGDNNAAFGYNALYSNGTGSFNTAIGSNADVASGNLTNATAIGANAIVGASNSLVLGGTGVNAVKVGIGTTTPGATLDVANTFRVLGTPSPISPSTGSGIEMNYDSLYNSGIIQAYDYDTSTWGTLRINTAQVFFGGAPGSQVAITGDLMVEGNLTKGGGSFKIDHPLDPKNKYLYHSFVESPDMKNIYDGVITTDEQGYAVVDLPDWFEALNRDFRYQLTIIGKDSWARARVYEELANNRFVIQTDVPNTKVSWQVTGIRKDAYADAHRIPVEEVKADKERGTCLHQEACREQ